MPDKNVLKQRLKVQVTKIENTFSTLNTNKDFNLASEFLSELAANIINVYFGDYNITIPVVFADVKHNSYDMVVNTIMKSDLNLQPRSIIISKDILRYGTPIELTSGFIYQIGVFYTLYKTKSLIQLLYDIKKQHSYTLINNFIDLLVFLYRNDRIVKQLLFTKELAFIYIIQNIMLSYTVFLLLLKSILLMNLPIFKDSFKLLNLVGLQKVYENYSNRIQKYLVIYNNNRVYTLPIDKVLFMVYSIAKDIVKDYIQLSKQLDNINTKTEVQPISYALCDISNKLIKIYSLLGFEKQKSIPEIKISYDVINRYCKDQLLGFEVKKYFVEFYNLFYDLKSKLIGG